MLDLSAFADIKMSTEPFTWGKSDRLFVAGTATELESLFPQSGFNLNYRDAGSDKCYRFALRQVLAPGARQVVAEGLADCWRNLLDQICGEAYREVLGCSVGMDLRPAKLEILFMAYGHEHWLSPHTDRHPKILTHIFYFGSNWLPEWGGRLLLLGDEKGSNICGEVLPSTGESVVLVRSERSWHAVEPVSASAPAVRRSLQVNFWASQPMDTSAGRQIGPMSSLS